MINFLKNIKNKTYPHITNMHFYLLLNKYKKYIGIIFFLIGSYGALKTTIGIYGFETDAAMSLMLWQGVHEHGMMKFIKSWIFLQNNYLFSTVPVHFLFYMIFGAKPIVTILVGWITFVVSAVICGLIAKKLNAPKSSILVPIILIFSGSYVYKFGYIAYSESQNIGFLLGLFILLTILSWIEKQKIFKLFFIAILTTAAGLSDPWFMATVFLPIYISSIFIFFLTKRSNKKIFAILFLVLNISLIFIHTKILGSFSFLPSANLNITNTDHAVENFFYLIKTIGGLLNIIPNESYRFISSLFSICVILYLFIKAIALTSLNNLFCNIQRLFFYTTIILSIIGIQLAFLLSDYVLPRDVSAHYLLNVLYFLILGLCIIMEKIWNKTERVLKYFCVIIVVLYIFSGIKSTIPYWLQTGIQLKTRSGGLIKFLSENNLKYGYGPYWGSDANAVTWLSNEAVRLRPIQFDRNTGQMRTSRHGLSSELWYKPEDNIFQTNEHFIFIKKDSEECYNIKVCLDGIIAQFGSPKKTLPFNDGYVLVWDHYLIDNEIENYMPYHIGDQITNIGSLKWNGWSSPEMPGTWSDGNKAEILLHLLESIKHDIQFSIEGNAFVAKKNPKQTIDVYANDYPIDSLEYTLENNGIRKLIIPKNIVEKNKNFLKIKFDIKNPRAPKDMGLSTDIRHLGIYIISIRLSYLD